MSEPETTDAPQAPRVDGDAARARLIITTLTGVVFLGVITVIYLLPHQSSGAGPSPLASLNALLNASATVCLVAGFIFIRRKNIVGHRRAMLAAFGLSCLFLISYLMHHARVGSVPFQRHGIIRTVYFSLLIPHILLAAGVVPMALTTIYRGFTGRIAPHKKLARWTLPIWLYVSVTGVLLYVMLYHI